MPKTLDLTKIKLGKNIVELVYLDFVMVGEDVYTKEVGEKCKAPATAEFKAAVGKLKKFVYTVMPLMQDKVVSLEITQISLKAEDDGLGITLSVTAQFKNVSRPSNFNTSYVSSLDNSNPLSDDVVALIETIKDQAWKYSEGLYEQASLDLSDDTVGPEAEGNEKNGSMSHNPLESKKKRGRPTNEMKKAREAAEIEEKESQEAAA